MRNFVKRQLIQWVAILAVLTGSLAPSISQAISVVQDGNGLAVEVCTNPRRHHYRCCEIAEWQLRGTFAGALRLG